MANQGQPDRRRSRRGHVTRRDFLTAAGAVSAAALLGCASNPRSTATRSAATTPPSPTGTRPNIILIVADDLGFAELGCQGCRDIPTPHIDSLATHGVRFTQGYVSAPLCSPSRAGLMTGRYQQRFGHEHNPGPEQAADPGFGLLKTETILPERLKPLGYATGMVGKWHLGYKEASTPTRRGFDEFFGFLAGAHPYLPNNQGAAVLRGLKPVAEREYLTDAFAREAVAFVEKHHDAPFFLYLPFNAVHLPLQAIEKYLARFPQIANPNRRTYAAMTAAMDDAVGRLLATLRARFLEEQTLIFFISDNGGPTAQTTSSNLPLRGHKAQVWDGGIHLPFLMQWKGHLPEGRTYTNPVISLDILPTAVTAAGGAVGADWKLDGVDLMPCLMGQKSERPHGTLCWRMGAKRAIRHGDYKIVQEVGEPGPQLFNLAEDIGEQKDLAAALPAKHRELADLYAAWDRQMIPPRWPPQGGQGPAVRRALRQGLGL